MAAQVYTVCQYEEIENFESIFQRREMLFDISGIVQADSVERISLHSVDGTTIMIVTD